MCGVSLVRLVLSKWGALDNHFNFIIMGLLLNDDFLLARGVALDLLVCKIRTKIVEFKESITFMFKIISWFHLQIVESHEMPSN
jgi:hypothetical protein